MQDSCRIRVVINRASSHRAELVVDGGSVHITGRWLRRYQPQPNKYSVFGRLNPARRGEVAEGDESDDSSEGGFTSMMLGSSDDEDEAAPVARNVAPDRLPAGSYVQLCGLLTRPDLNGTMCEVLHFDDEVVRYAVQLPDGSNIRVKPECVTRAVVGGSRAVGKQSGGRDPAHQRSVKRGPADEPNRAMRRKALQTIDHGPMPKPARAFAAKYSPFATSKVSTKDFRDTNAFKKQSRIARRVPKELQEVASKKGGSKKGRR